MRFNRELTKILLSGNVAEIFTSRYQNDEAFKKLTDEIIPEVAACFNQAQNSPWHICNVMEHILRSVEEMNKQTAGFPENERKLLAYVMFIHDLGKPAYHKEKEVNGKKMDSFAFHNLGSEKVAARILPYLDFDEKERAIILMLVREHDIFLKFCDSPLHDWQIKPTPEFVKGFISELDKLGNGKQIFDYLLLVGIADNNAQNPSMTKAPLALIQRIKNMANSIVL